MSTLKGTLKKILPDPVLDAARGLNDALGRSKDWPSAAFHPWRRDSMRRLAALKDTHRGQRCFLIVNGPSLKNTDLHKLEGEFSIECSKGL